MGPSSTQGIDFLLRKRLHNEFGSWSAQAAHSRGTRDGAAGSCAQPLVAKVRSRQLVLHQRRPARDQRRIGIPIDTGRPALNFSTVRPTPNLSLAEGAKLLSLGEKTCAIAGNGVGFNTMAGRRLLRRNVTESDGGKVRPGGRGVGAARRNTHDERRIGEARRSRNKVSK
jgi:hypothetical protein